LQRFVRKGLVHRIPLPQQYSCRDTHGDRVWGHVRQDNGVGSDSDVIADVNGSQNFCSGSYVDSIANGRGPAQSGVPESDGHSIADHTIVSKNRVSADDNSTKMIDAKSAAQSSFTRQFYPGKTLAERLQKFVCKRKWETQPPRSNRVTPPSIPIEEHRPESMS
jgi:hypothetical protein